MLAYGKLDRSLMAKGYFQGCLGFEFSGAALGGGERRVMGVARRALATQVCAQDNLVNRCPAVLRLDCLRAWQTMACTLFSTRQACTQRICARLQELSAMLANAGCGTSDPKTEFKSTLAVRRTVHKFERSQPCGNSNPDRLASADAGCAPRLKP